MRPPLVLAVIVALLVGAVLVTTARSAAPNSVDDLEPIMVRAPATPAPRAPTGAPEPTLRPEPAGVVAPPPALDDDDDQDEMDGTGSDRDDDGPDDG